MTFGATRREDVRRGRGDGGWHRFSQHLALRAAHSLAAGVGIAALLLLPACQSVPSALSDRQTAVPAPTSAGKAATRRDGAASTTALKAQTADPTGTAPDLPPAAAVVAPTSSSGAGVGEAEPAATSVPAGVGGLPSLGPAPTATTARAPTAAPAASSTAAPSPTSTPAAGAPGEADQRTTRSWQDRAVDFPRGQFTGTRASAEGVRLAEGEGSFAAEGEYLSEVREAGFPFDNAVLSWNADTPAATSVRFDLRVRTAEGWSGWYGVGEWSSAGGRSVPGQSDAHGRVDVDTLKLNTPATALQYRAKLSTASNQATPLVRQVSVVYADLKKGLSGPPITPGAAAGRDLDVPRHSQLQQDPAVASKICSATSLAMVMQYWGSKKSVPEVVAGVKDRTTGIFGNWPLNTAFAGANGLDARVERFYSVEQLEQEVAAGRPAIISIAFNPGELSASPISSTDGHLIVVRGFTTQGDVIVNDPIAPNSSSVRLVYNRAQLGRIWLRSGGIVYLVSPRSQ